MFPRPMAEPAIAIMTADLLPKCSLFALISWIGGYYFLRG